MKVAIVVHPNSKKPRIEKDLLDTLHVYVNQPPLEGRANKAVAESLAEYFKVKRNCVKLLSGEKSKNKLFDIKKNQ
ncbi:MAG: DUF167 domain-containing protein [Candidatus Levybacteria bacterium]|nr:DUF167 domain-containing protein [Candidatus Levybacteria bacterium]